VTTDEVLLSSMDAPDVWQRLRLNRL
jgi:hypothetical protein